MRRVPFGPTYEEMLYPNKAPSEIRQKAIKALKENEMDPVNLFNITWKDENNAVPLEKVVRHFRRKIWNVRLDKQDKLIGLSANLKDPELAKVIVAVAIGELQRILNNKSFSVAGQNRLFIEKRLKEVATDLQGAELDLVASRLGGHVHQFARLEGVGDALLGRSGGHTLLDDLE